MSAPAMRSGLTSNQQQLLEMIRRLYFGQIQDLRVRGGEPVFEPPPRLINEIKFCAENGPLPKMDLAEFAVKAQVRDLFNHLRALGTGVVHRLEVKHGLPFHMMMEREG